MEINRIRLADDAADIEHNMNKAISILGDLLEDYSFVHEEPTQEEIERITFGASRIIMFTNIAYDYLVITKENVKKLRDGIVLQKEG